MHSGAIHGGDDVLRGAGGGGDHVNAHFQAGGHHAQRIVHASLRVEDELLREQVQDFAIGGQRDRTRLVHGLPDLLACDLAGASTEGDAAVSIEPAHVRSGHSDEGVLDGRARTIFGALDGVLDGRRGFLQIHDDALARAARLGDAVAAIAQAVVTNLGHQSACLGAAYIDGRK